MKKSNLVTVFVLGFLIIISCSKSESILENEAPDLPETPFNYLSLKTASGSLNLKNVLKDETKNLLSNHTATLGRVLFYDKKLSINNTTSCGSCHIQQLAFADGQATSRGFKNIKTSRNSMAIINPVLSNHLFWDSRVNSTLELALKPVFDHVEMGMLDAKVLIGKLEQTSYYPELFDKAFGIDEITENKIGIALSHFVNSIFSQDSKFDRFTARIPGGELSPLEEMGRKLFNSPKAKCSQCHAGINASAPDFPGGRYGPPFGNSPSLASEDNPKGTTNIGLDEIYKDNGKGNGNFRIPSLRNIELTAPYMHDGRFKTLEEVVEHYNRGVRSHAHLDPTFKDANENIVQLNLTETEKNALVAFLKTFTDYNLISDVKFSDPFH